jgi:GTP cyclohydrolase-4
MARDVQSERPANSFRLEKVGVRGVMKPVQVSRPGKTVTLPATFDVFVDVPASQRGSHLSRHLEVIQEIVDASVRAQVPGLEELAETIATSLLKRHETATHSEVWARADYFLERTSPWGRRSLEPYRLVAKATADRGRPLRTHRAIGVEVVGMTACPCAMETIRDDLASRTAGASGVPDGLPVITHNQRNRTTVMIDVPEGSAVEADDLIEIAESSLSSPTYELLKRPEEARLVEAAHRRPRFVEDVVREVLARILKTYAAFPDSALVSVKSESEESIHKHNAFAERTTTLGELRR